MNIILHSKDIMYIFVDNFSENLHRNSKTDTIRRIIGGQKVSIDSKVNGAIHQCPVG